MEQAIRFLAARGLDEDQVRQGSIPAASLNRLAEILAAEFGPRRTLGLHVGNFVGVSLAAVAAANRSRCPDSLVIAIDPNIPHRGIPNPQEHVAALLDHFGLAQSVLPVAGYSLEKSVSNDGIRYDGAYDPLLRHADEHACANTLPHLCDLLPERFDFVLIDGNHDDAYLARELQCCARLLRSGGLLVLDDVCETWAGIMDLFFELGDGYECVLMNDRIGIARKR